MLPVHFQAKLLLRKDHISGIVSESHLGYLFTLYVSGLVHRQV